MVLERLVGQFKLGDIEITGLADKHKCEPAPPDKPGSASADLHVETCPPNNVMAFDNAIQIVETGGLRVAIWATIGRRLIPPSIITSKMLTCLFCRSSQSSRALRWMQSCRNMILRP